MERKNFKVSTAGLQTSTGLILMDGLWLFVSLLFFLPVLGWATWGMRLVNPMAFAMFAGSMAGGTPVSHSGCLVPRNPQRLGRFPEARIRMGLPHQSCQRAN